MALGLNIQKILHPTDNINLKRVSALTRDVAMEATRAITWLVLSQPQLEIKKELADKARARIRECREQYQWDLEEDHIYSPVRTAKLVK